MTAYKTKKTAGKIGLYVLMLIVVLPVLFPLYLVFIFSLRSISQVYIMPPQLFGFTLIWDHRKHIFETQHYNTYMVNSTVAAFASTTIFLIPGIPASYSITRFHIRRTFIFIPVARLLSSISLLPPYYFLFSKLKVIDTYSVLILNYTAPSLPLTMRIMSSFTADIPKELDKTAIVGGCTRQRCSWNIILLIGLPELITCATLSFLGSRNNFQFALILGEEKMRTLPVSLQYFASGTDIYWGRVLAAMIVAIVPVIILTVALQRYAVKGMIAGAVEG